jgi:hypothetical protein
MEKLFLGWKKSVGKRADGTVADDSEEYNLH